MLSTRGKSLSIHLPPFRPRVSTLGLYQDPKADCSSRTRAGVAGSILHRRYSPHGGVQGETKRPGCWSGLPVAVSGIYHKHGEDNTVHGFSGFHGQHDQYGTQFTSRKIEDQSGSSETVGGGAYPSSVVSTACRENECNNGSDSPSTSVLLSSADGPIGSPTGSRTGL